MMMGRSDHRPEGSAAVEDGHAERALPYGEPLGDDLGGAGPVAGFAEAEQEAETIQAEQARGEGVEHAGQRPDHNRNGEAAAIADAVVEFRERLAKGVGDQKGVGDTGELQVRQLQLLGDHRRQHGDGQAVDEVDQGGEEDESGDPPSQTADSGGRRFFQGIQLRPTVAPRYSQRRACIGSMAVARRAGR